jgi:hypothetical protein
MSQTERILPAMSSDRAGVSSRFVPVAALGGVVLGHWITYLIVFPRAAGREATLAGTGHGYLPAAAALAIACALLAGSGAVLEQVRRVLRRSHARTGDPIGSAAIRLATLQSSLFVVQEVLERLRVGAPLSALGRGGFLLVGISVQIAVAVAIALVLAILARGAAAVARALATREVAPNAADVLAPARLDPPIQPVGGARRRPRAPPLALPV